MEYEKIKNIIFQFVNDIVRINLNYALTWTEARDKANEKYLELLEIVNITLK